MGNNTVATETEEKWDADTLKKREDQRNQLRQIIFEAHEAGADDRRDAARRLLSNDDLEYTFDELPYNKDYVSSLYRGFKRSNGEDAEISVKKTKELIENDFEFFNMVKESSLVMGGVNLVDIMDNYDDSQKADMLRRLETYDKVDAFSRGSRPFIEQLKGVGAGVGVDVVATGGLGALYKLVTKPFTHKIEGEILKSVLSPTQKLATVSAGYGGTFDVEQQATEMQLRPDQEYDPVRTGVTTTISALAPTLGKPIGKGIGILTRPIQHAPTSFGIFAKKFSAGKDWVGGLASSKKLQDAFDAVGLRGVDLTKGTSELSFNLKNTWKNINNSFDGQYKNLGLVVKQNDIESVIRGWSNSRLPMLDSVKDLMDKLKPSYRRMSGYGTGKGSAIPSTADTAETLRKLKKILWTAADDAKRGKSKKFDSSDIEALNGFRHQLIRIEDKAALTVGKDTHIQYKQLKKDFGEFEDMKGSDMGRTIRDIVSKKGDDSTKSSGKLARDMVTGDFAWNDFNLFVDAIEGYGRIEGRKGAAKNIRGDIQNSVGYFLRESNGKRLVKLLESPDGRGMKLLKGLYPDDIKVWNSIEAFAEKLSKHSGPKHGHTGSVIANMVTARLGSKIGYEVAGEGGKVVGMVMGIPLLTGLLQSKFWQGAMVNAINNKGRLPGAAHKWLKKQGLSKKQIFSIQDAILGLPFAGFSLGNIEEIWDKAEDSIEARIEEIRRGFLF